MSQPLLFTGASSRRPDIWRCSAEHGLFQKWTASIPRFSAGIIDERLEVLLGPSDCPEFDQFALEISTTHFCKIAAMGVTIELQNLGDAELCREIAVGIEHALSEKTGEWRVSIAGSRETENWDMRVEGPNGFERTYTLSGAAGQHGPDAIRKMILQLVSS